jgi:hypothetical protein
MYWTGAGSLVYNPFDPDAAGILFATIDNILQTYKGIDYIWLWLNEHSLFGVDLQAALQNRQMKSWYEKYAGYYSGPGITPTLKFFGVWSQAYIQRAYDYIKQRSPQTKIVIGGWGGKDQMTLLLRGLNKTLPPDIIFSLLNPAQGQEEQPPVLAEIARSRKVWAIPWLEGDNSLWHLQPRVNMIRRSVKDAAKDGLSGVVVIHWRTAETRPAFAAFSHFANQPADTMSTAAFYRGYCFNRYGKHAAGILAPLLTRIDTTGIISTLKSPVYYAYDPSWGRLDLRQSSLCKLMIDSIDKCIALEQAVPEKVAHLKWLRANFQFDLLLDSVSRGLGPAYQLRNKVLSGKEVKDNVIQRYKLARDALEGAPVKRMFQIFCSKVTSRGELGELSSLNQRVWSEYLLLNAFCRRTR